MNVRAHFHTHGGPAFKGHHAILALSPLLFHANDKNQCLPLEEKTSGIAVKREQIHCKFAPGAFSSIDFLLASFFFYKVARVREYKDTLVAPFCDPTSPSDKISGDYQ